MPEKDELLKEVASISDVAAEKSFRVSRISDFASHNRAFLRVQDGCNRRCAYCIVPYARGPERSAPLEEAVAQAVTFAARGFEEIVVTGQATGSYLVYPVRGKKDGGGQVSIGCSDECDVSIDDVSVSRTHAFIERQGDRFFVMDNSSTNGTQINGLGASPGTWWELESGDSVTIGNT